MAHSTLKKLGRIAPRTRQADEFARALASAIRPQIRPDGPYTWDLESIRSARDSQYAGSFALPVQLAEAIRSDDALYTAYLNRIAPQSAVQTKLVAHASARGENIARKAEQSVFAPRAVVEGIHGTLVNHGIAIGYLEHEPNDAGTQIDVRLAEWPLEHVRWNASREILETTTYDGDRVDILHGDGQWVVFRKFSSKPWTQEACILPAALLWAAHANGISDWAQSSFAHGLAKIVGELPEGVALSDGTNLTNEAQYFLTMLNNLANGEASAGVRPAGAKTDFLANGSTAWQVFSELILNREKAAARIYLGTDAMLGSVGGAPGVDIATLFGVATTRVQSDFAVIESAIRTGVYEPWCAINFGDSRLAPALKYQMPDPDAERKREHAAANWTRFHETLAGLREQKVTIDQPLVDRIASEYGISPAPRLAAPATPAEAP